MRHVRAERRTHAMGTGVHVVVIAPGHYAAALAGLAVERISLLEDCWSRFRAASELSRLNARAGSGPVTVSNDLAALIAAMIRAAAWSEGACDASVLRAVEEIGYDADFSAVLARSAVEAATGPGCPAPGVSEIVLDPETRAVDVPVGVTLDPGAIGKGLAADIVADEIHDAGADGVLVNLGGDVSARGAGGASGEADWRVAIRDDRREESPIVATVSLADGQRAVATSSTLRRRWHGRHHVIDPDTGRSSASDVSQATVIAPTGWQAEAAATLALVRGTAHARPWLAREGLSAALFPLDATAPPWLSWEDQDAG